MPDVHAQAAMDIRHRAPTAEGVDDDLEVRGESKATAPQPPPLAAIHLDTTFISPAPPSSNGASRCFGHRRHRGGEQAESKDRNASATPKTKAATRAAPSRC
jgi:hypothetical protein